MITSQERAVALLESAGWCVIVSGLLFAIAVVNRQLTQSATMERIVSGVSIDHQEPLWTLTPEGTLAFHHSGVDQMRSVLQQKLMTETRRHFPDREIGGLVCSYESEIDPIVGNFVSTVRKICQGFGGRDSLANRLDIEFSRLSALQPFPGAKAVPGSRDGEFFPRSAIFGVAVSRNQGGDDQSGSEPVISARLVLPTHGVELR